MSINKTPIFGLHLWEPGDDFLRAEFNENFAALDDAARVVCGTYTGDGAESQFITLGFTPRAVFVASTKGQMNDNYRGYSGLATPDSPAAYIQTNYHFPLVYVEEGGFRVYRKEGGSTFSSLTNLKDMTFNFLALR